MEWNDPLPRDEDARQRIRDNIVEHYNLDGYRKARDYHLSLRCLRGDHDCRNDGTGCLCRCHDLVGLKGW